MTTVATPDPEQLFAAVATTGAAFLAALEAAATSAGCTVGAHVVREIQSCMKHYPEHWRAQIAERDRPKGPVVAVRLLNWRGEAKPSGRATMEFMRRTATTIVLRCEGVGGDRGPTVIQIATGKEKVSRDSYNDAWEIVDLPAALAIEWTAPRPARATRAGKGPAAERTIPLFAGDGEGGQ